MSGGHVTLLITLREKSFCYLYFTHEETEAQGVIQFSKVEQLTSGRARPGFAQLLSSVTLSILGN